MSSNIVLSSCQAAGLLKINENTLNSLAVSGIIPSIQIPASNGLQYRFNTFDITNCLKNGLTLNNQNAIKNYQMKIQKRFPEALANLHEYNKNFVVPRRGKGYSLTLVPNKKLGNVYHVRFIENGRIIPTWRSTHTNDYEAAVLFAVNNRDKVLADYHRKMSREKNVDRLYPIFRKYYEKDSVYLKKDTLRGRTLGEDARRTYHNSVINNFIPFLRKNNITSIDEINTPLMVKYQDYCLSKGRRPQTVNHYVNFVSNIFDYLLIRGQIKTNPCSSLVTLRVKEKDYEKRGCYQLNELRNIFCRRWPDEFSYLLNLLIYFTGMRNSEIDRIQVKDIIKINRTHFIHIPVSKTRNGERFVPLHDFVFMKLNRYIQKHAKKSEDLLFSRLDGKHIPRGWYTDANLILGKFTGRDKNQLRKENITYYSGRHYWKTLMNAYDLGEIEEYFMGHKVTNDVAKRYNHRDKQGQDKIVQKAREVFKILDKNFLQKKN